MHPWDPRSHHPVDLVVPVRLDPTGEHGPTRHQAAGPQWRRTSYGFHVPVDTDSSRPEQRILEQSVRLPTGGAITGWAACRWWGANLLDGLLGDGVTEMPVPLALGRGGHIRGDRLVLLNRDPLDEVVLRHGVPVVRRRRAAYDAIRLAPTPREGVVAMDMMAAAELTSIRRVREYAEQHPHFQRSGVVHLCLDLASEWSRSPNETQTRLVWVLDARLPPPLVNCPVWDLAGRLLGVADLLDPSAGLVVEFNGADHRAARRHSRDVSREAAFRRAGLEMTHVTGPDLVNTDLVVDRMHEARSRALLRPPGKLGWRIDPPPGWPLPLTLDQRLDDAEFEARWRQERRA